MTDEPYLLRWPTKKGDLVVTCPRGLTTEECAEIDELFGLFVNTLKRDAAKHESKPDEAAP